jgi:acyl-CoA synthetase (NDP forming)
MLTTPDEIAKPSSVAERLPKLFADARKPVVVSIDSGSKYEPLAQVLRAAGVPVFRSADQAVRTLGRYLCQRVQWQQARIATMEAHEVPLPDAPPGVMENANV